VGAGRTDPGEDRLKLIIRWKGQTAEAADGELERLVRAGKIPPDAWIISSVYTHGHAIQAQDLEVYHLWRPAPEPTPPSGPSILAAIYRRRGLSVTEVLLVANLLVSAWLLLTWRAAFSMELSHWTRELKPEIRGPLDVPTLLMPTFVHATPGHLFGNLLYLFAFGAVVEYVLGSWRTLAVYLVSGYVGSLLSFLLLPSPGVSVGASGAIFGLIGAAASYLMRHRANFHERLQWRARRVYIPMVIAVALYSIAAGNLVAHGGGFATGAVVALLLDRPLPAAQRRGQPRP
jgi:membrane associated rhomboid family serine protease